MDNINVLVFPCGSEIGLEINRCLRYIRYITLFGANSIDDHGKFVYSNYIADIPNIANETDCISSLKKIVTDYKIDIIYPAMDAVITLLERFKTDLGCKIASSGLLTSEICLSKEKTYNLFQNLIPIPIIYKNVKDINNFPVFVKPIIGYGSRGVKKILDQSYLLNHLREFPNSIIMEYLPGKEYTIDCFTDREGQLKFVGPRERKRTMNGISVNTENIDSIFSKCSKMAHIINKEISFRGAWFFQLKEGLDNKLKLLEIACRFGGSSSLQRARGINFPLLTILDQFNYPIEIMDNSIKAILDRALDNKYKIHIEFNQVYFDLDDCLIIHNKINLDAIKFIFQLRNEDKRIILLTRHAGDLNETLNKFKIGNLFDEIHHLKCGECKSDFITSVKSLFFDDSFAERKKVKMKKNIPVYGPESFECFIL